MSHITCDAERVENQAIWDCPHRAVAVWTRIDDGWSEPYDQWGTENQCGEIEHVSVAKDRCKRCGKVFTY